MLSGLELSAASELAYTILKRVGVDTNEWKSPDHAQLQLVLEALQCLPDTLNKILPLAKLSGVPWSSFYTTLICNTHEVVKHIPAEESCAVWDVISCVRQNQPSGVFRCLMLLGAYWYEAPDEKFLKVVEITKYIGGDENLQLAIGFAILGGLIAENGQQGFWVHPLFTIFARTWEIWDRSTPIFTWALRQGMAKLALSGASPEYWFIRALCEPNMDRIKNSPDEKDFLAGFMGSMEAHCAVDDLVGAVNGIDYQDTVLTYHTRLPNLLGFIQICRGAGESLQLQQWPRQFLASSSNNIRITGRVPEMELFAHEYELLLNSVIFRLALKGSKAIPSEHVVFVLFIASYLASTHLSDVHPANDRSEEFVTLALDIGDQSEPQGGFKDPTTIYLRGLTFRYKYFLTVRQARRDKVEESISTIQKYWELSDENDKRYIEALDKAQEEAQLQSVARRLYIPDKFKTIQSQVTAQPIQRAHVEARKKYSSIKDVVIRQLRTGNTDAAKETMKPVLRELSKGLKGVHTALEDFGYHNFREQTTWAPPNLNMVKYHDTLGTEKNQLDELANALDEGDVYRAAEARRSLVFLALKKNDLDEAMEHFDSVREFYAGDPQHSEHSEGHNGQASVAIAHRSQAALDALSDSSIESATAVLKHNERVVAAMKTQGIPELQGVIRAVEIGGQLWKKALEQNPTDLAAGSRDLGARTRKSQMAFLKLAMDYCSKPEGLQRMSQQCLDIQTSWLERSKAQDDENLDEELQIIARQLQLTETDFGKVMPEFLNSEELKRDHENIKLRQDWKRLMDDEDFGGARMRLKSASERDSAEILERLWEATEKIQLSFEMAEAEKEAKSDSLSVSRYDKLLNMHGSGEFSHMDQTSVASNIKVIRNNRSWALSSAAMQAKQWETAITYLDECLAIAEDELRAIYPRKYDDALETKESIEIMLHTDELQRKDHECEYGDAQRHIDALRRLVERWRTSANVRSPLPAKGWTPELLDRAQSQLNWKKIIIRTMGQENGKAFILASRQAPGSQWPNW